MWPLGVGGGRGHRGRPRCCHRVRALLVQPALDTSYGCCAPDEEKGPRDGYAAQDAVTDVELLRPGHRPLNLRGCQVGASDSECPPQLIYDGPLRFELTPGP